jgi:hypothetical protein
MFDTDFTSTFNICEKFGTKDIITDKITYDYADYCRKVEDKCGQEGKYFAKDPYIKLKIIKHWLISRIPFFLCSFAIGSIIANAFISMTK